MSIVGKKLSGVFYGWWIVAAGVLLCMFGYGGWFYSFGTLFNPIREEFGWSVATTSLAFSLSRLEGGLEGIITGPLIDKYGPKFMVRLGFTMAGVGFICMYFIQNFAMFILFYTILLSLGMNAGLYMPLQTSVAKWFDKKRGLALGFLTTGAAVGGSIFAPFTAWMIDRYEWRIAVVVLGILALVFGWTLSFVLKPKSPEFYGLGVDGNLSAANPASGGGSHHGNSSAESGLTIKEAIKTRTFWLIVIAFTCAHTAVSAITVHEIPLIENMGIDKVTAAATLGMMTLMSAPGRLLGGWVADRLNLKYLFAVSALSQAGALYLFSRVSNLNMVWVFVAWYGLSYGFRIPLEPAMRAQYFGRKHFGTIMGYVNAFAVIGSFAGPYFAGWVYDTTQSYSRAFVVFAAMMALASVIILFASSPLAKKEAAGRLTHA